MKSNVVRVLLWGKEVCRIQWEGGYKEGFGKVGALVSFNPEYKYFGFDVDPLGDYRLSQYIVQKGLSDICRATECEGLPRFMSASMPDDWGNQVFSSWMRKNNIRSHEISPVDKLAFIGKRGMGGFEFLPELYSTSNSDNLILDELYKVAREIEESREETMINLNDNPAVQDLMKVGMSAGGKHPKAIIAINNETGEIRSGQVPLPEGFTQYILKFKDSDIWPAAEVEYSYHLMAKAVGIKMEKCSLLQIAGVNHFLTERFDRKCGKKIHSATLRALCGETTSYEDIFKACRRLHLPYAELEQLFRRTVFNYLACVCDDHDKNFSFILNEDGNWHLSPAYDETFTMNFKNSFIGDRHNMTIDECSRNITKDQLLRLAEENDIRHASEIIDEITDGVKGFYEIAIGNEVGTEFGKIIQDCIEKQLTTLKSTR